MEENIYSVEYEADDEGLEDYPDPPREPQDPLRPLEASLGRFRIRFNWDAPNENKSTYDDLTVYQKSYYNSLSSTEQDAYDQFLLDSENDGLAPEQSPVFQYRIVIQQKDVGGAWDTANPVEDDTTKNTHYVYHADAASADLTKKYRAKIYSIDKDGTQSQYWLNSNTGNLVYDPDSDDSDSNLDLGGDGNTGGTTENPVSFAEDPTVRRRVKALFVQWETELDAANDQPAAAEPIKYEVHVVRSTIETQVQFTATGNWVQFLNYNSSTLPNIQTGDTVYFYGILNSTAVTTNFYYTVSTVQRTAADGSAYPRIKLQRPGSPTQDLLFQGGSATIGWSPQTFSFTPSFQTRVGQTMGNSKLVTKWADDTASTKTLSAFEKKDSMAEFYVAVVAKNIINGQYSDDTTRVVSNIIGPVRPKRRLTSNSDGGSGIQAAAVAADFDDVYEIVANRFVADDGTGDRIVISDSRTTKASIQFIGVPAGTNNQNITTMSVGGAGNVTVSGAGHVYFQSGIRLPFIDKNSLPTGVITGMLAWGKSLSTTTPTANVLYLRGGSADGVTNGNWVYFSGTQVP